MSSSLTRRKAVAVAGAALLPGLSRAARPAGHLVENVMHMFATDQARFPVHANAPYTPQANSLEDYIAFTRKVKLDHTVIVQPEPYQDDHRYLLYCFTREPSPGYFRGTCLFDPTDPATPRRMEELVQTHPGRIVALRMHEVHEPGTPFAASGAIKNRDLRSPAMKNTWKKVHELGLIVQIQMLPYYAPMLRELAAEFSDTPVLLDHLALASRGTPEQYEEVIRLSGLPRVHMKVSQLNQDSKPLVRRLFDAYGPERLVWGSFGGNQEAFDRNLAQIEQVFDYASEADRVKIRGGNAMKLFGFTG